MKELWSACMRCRDNSCCKMEIAHPLFVTPGEMSRIANLYAEKAVLFNKVFPCPFSMENGFCMIHEQKPFDCRLFPFDIYKIDGSFHWVVWQIDCLILQDESRFEEYIADMEKRLLPDFIPYLDDYSLFRREELFSKYDYRVLREVRLYSAVEMKSEVPSIESVLAKRL